MMTLHIEHGISDLATWQAAFDRFADLRQSSGVLAHRISQPVDDDHYILVDLDFAEAGQAQRFLTFLREKVWGSGDAPALVGDPHARILSVVRQST